MTDPAVPIRLVVFDLDGTLIDSSQDLATAVNAALSQVAPAFSPFSEARVRSLIGNGATHLISESLAAAGLAIRVEDVLPVFLDCYRRCLLDRTRLYAGVAETLDALSGRTLAVLTNKPGDMSRAILEGLGIARRFVRIYGGDDLSARKPDPVGLLRLFAERSLTAIETVMVGDSGIDIRTGRAVGAWTAGVSYGYDPEGLERNPPDFLIRDLRELPGLISAPAAG